MKKIILSLSFLFVISTWCASAQITSYPYLEDFESGDGGWVVDAASPGSWALGAPAAAVINSADSGANAWVTNLGGDYVANENGNVISPVFDLSSLNAPSIQMSVWWNSEFSWDGAVLQSSIDGGASWQNVGALGDPNNWYNDGTIAGNPGGQQVGWTGRAGTGSGGWVVARHALIGLAGEANVIFRVGFGSDGSIQDEGFAFDTISVFEVTCPDPFAVTVDAVTENSAEINWTPGGSETTWEIVIQDAGTGVPTGPGVSTMNNNPYSAGALTPSTAYEVYIRSDCDADGLSTWVGPTNFTTLNTPPPPPVGVTCATGSSSFIFSENFDQNPPIGWTGTGFSGDNGNWDIANADDNSFGTGPANAYDGGVGTHLEYEAGGDATDIASAVSPVIDLTDAEDGAELSFFFHAFGQDMGTLNVGVANTAAGPFTSLFTWVGDLQITDDEAWVPVGINLDAYLGQQIFLEFSYGGSGTGFEGDMAIDFIRVETCGSFCIAPSGITVANITGTSADIDWDANSGETSWEYVVVPAGSGEPTGSGTTIGMTSENITGLDFQTDYEVWVRADCGGQFSLWSGPVAFTTTIQINFDVDCDAGPVDGFLCYGDNDSELFTYTSSNGLPLNLTINSGQVEGAPFDFLLVLDSDGVTELYNGEGNDGDLSGLTFQSTGDTIFIQILSDGSVSCEAGSLCCSDGIDFTVACATCINPAATYQVVDDCASGDQFLIDVNITSLGDANSLTITNNIDATATPVPAIGTYQIGPFPFLVDVVVTVSSDDDVNCVINSSAFQLLACPPTNNNPCEAIVAVVNDGILCEMRTPGSIIEATASGVADPSCGGTADDDVWFQFEANSESQLIALANIAGSNTTDIDHSVYSGTCDNLTEIACVSDFAELSSVASGLTIGETYFIRIYSGGTNSETTTFDICITPYIAPENVECDLAEDYCSGSDASDILYSYNTINVLPGFGNIDCLGTSPNPTFNLLRIATSGDILIEMVQNTAFDENDIPIGDELDVDFILWGPYAPGDPLCDATNVGLGTIVDCSYSPDPLENVTLTGAIAGEIYLLLITNFEEEAGVIQVRQTNAGETGAGTTVADLEVDLGPDQSFCGFPDFTIDADAPSADTFEWYANGFIIAGETGPTLTVSTTDTYTVIAYNDGCDAEAMDSITITFGQEAVANAVPDIVTCDDISADGIEDFDLEIRTAGVLDGQSATDFNVTYHLSLMDAQNNVNPLMSPYTNIMNPQTIYVRVEDANADFCSATTSFDLVVAGPTPTANTDTYPECDDDSDGMAAFDLPTRDAIVLGGQSAADFSVTYYETEADAEAGINPINTSMLYNSVTTTIYVRVDNNLAFDCYITTTMDLVVNPSPDNTFVLDDLVTCDDASADGFEDFNLEVQTAIVIGSQNPADFNVTYHDSQADADLGIDPLVSPYTNTSNPQTIVVRIESVSATVCYVTATFNIEVSGPRPVATSVPIEECEDDITDGVAFFDLAAHDANVLNGQSATDFSVTYYESEADAEAGTNPIDTSVLFESASQTIYARVTSVVSFGCYSIAPFDLIVKPLPRTSFASNFDYEVCPDTIDGIIITATPENYDESEVSITWYRNGDPIPGANGLELQVLEGDDYQIEVTFNDATGCSSITEQEVVQLDNCVIPQGISPNGDGSNDRFDLSSFDVTKLEIFNRNGTLVYSKTNYTDEWFGQTNDGNELPVGTYFYTMEYKDGQRRTAWVYIQRLN